MRTTWRNLAVQLAGRDRHDL